MAVREPLGGLEARGARRLRSASPEPCADSPPIARARLEPAAESRRAYAIDDRTEGDELAVVDYVDGLYEYYRDVEVATAKRVDMYMDFQLDITPKMRSILVDWLIEVHTKFKMTQPTIYLTVHIIDRCVLPASENAAQRKSFFSSLFSFFASLSLSNRAKGARALRIPKPTRAGTCPPSRSSGPSCSCWA